MNRFIILILIFISCKSNNNNLYVFDPILEQANEIKLSDIADDVFYVPLDNVKPLGSMYHDPKFVGHSIFIYVNNEGIIEFSNDGKRVRNIGLIGRGPGEYTLGNRFTVDDKTGTIYVLDQYNVIKVYSNSGYYIRKIQLPAFGSGIELIDFYDSELFLSYWLQLTDAIYEWIAIDTLGNIIKTKEKSIPSFTSGLGAYGGTYKLQNKLYYWNPYKDTVMAVLPDEIEKPSFIIGEGKHRLPRGKFDALTQLKQYMIIDQIFETNRFIFIRFRYFSINYALAVFDKKDRKSYLTYFKSEVHGGIVNDFDAGASFLPKSHFLENGREYIAGLINPNHIRAIAESDDFKISKPVYPEKKAEFARLARKLSDADNPVLMVIKLKK